jgi:hypothetical protein
MFTVASEASSRESTLQSISAKFSPCFSSSQAKVASFTLGRPRYLQFDNFDIELEKSVGQGLPFRSATCQKNGKHSHCCHYVRVDYSVPLLAVAVNVFIACSKSALS